jgi:hypothetical protein
MKKDHIATSNRTAMNQRQARNLKMTKFLTGKWDRMTKMAMRKMT